MDDSELRTTELEAGKRPSITEAVESLFRGATASSNRAANCDDPGWRQFHLAAAAAYKEWALQLEPLVSIHARIEEQAGMIRCRFNLPALPGRGTPGKPEACESQETVTAPQSIDASNDLVLQLRSGKTVAPVPPAAEDKHKAIA